MAKIVQVRGASHGDGDALFRMARCLATYAVLDRTAFASSLSAILADDRQLILVAFIEEEDEPVGYLHGLAHAAFHANGTIAWVEELWVDDDHRRAGVARSLMGRFEGWAANDAKAEQVALATRRVADFYAALGYAESATYFTKNLQPSDQRKR